MDDENSKPEPWWRVGPMWLVVLGPVIVIVAAFVTLFIAVRTPDPVVADDYYRKGLDITKLKPEEAQMMPAMQARNHAATPKSEGPAPTKP
ncbi:MAG: hypothetical protein RLZZ24_1272 [Pseudomonadota bacterium]|jgi:hypothetical protein